MRRVAIALFVVGIAIYISVIGFIWMLVLATPFYVMIIFAIFWIARTKQKKSAAEAQIARDAERQRMLNRQELNAWRSAAEGGRESKGPPRM